MNLGRVIQTQWTNFDFLIPLMLYVQFGFNQPNSFGEGF